MIHEHLNGMLPRMKPGSPRQARFHRIVEAMRRAARDDNETGWNRPTADGGLIQFAYDYGRLGAKIRRGATEEEAEEYGDMLAALCFEGGVVGTLISACGEGAQCGAGDELIREMHGAITDMLEGLGVPLTAKQREELYRRVATDIVYGLGLHRG